MYNFFVNENDITENTAIISGADFNHIKKVLRLREGDTFLVNPAREPEIEELCCFLIKMGASIKRNVDGSILIKGKRQLHDVEYNIVSDRIV